MSGVRDVERLHAMLEAERQAEREALLNDARLRNKSARMVTVDSWFHWFNILWSIFAVFLSLIAWRIGDATAAVGFTGLTAFQVRNTVRYIREDWRGIKDFFTL